MRENERDHEKTTFFITLPKWYVTVFKYVAFGVGFHFLVMFVGGVLKGAGLL